MLAGLAAVVFAAGLWIRHNAPAVDDVGLQKAGSARAAHALVGDPTADFRKGLTADFFLIGAYTLSMVLVFWLSSRTIAVRMRHRCSVGYGIAGVLAACGCAVAEKLLLLHGLDGADWLFAVATGLAPVKWLLLVLTVPVAAFVVAIILKRAVFYGWALHIHDYTGTGGGEGKRGGGTASPSSWGPDVGPPWPVMESNGRRWPTVVRKDPPRSRQARWENGSRVPTGREQGGLGFCVSGCGIRSACVTLGALQALRSHLCRAATWYPSPAAATQREPSNSRWPGRASAGRTGTGAGPDEVFMPGTLEADHTSRHSKYVAEAPATGWPPWAPCCGAWWPP
ncbi:hypothetical protein [Streptomyces sp. S186]|uniref:hypothetical protein n=1 Tax=Streptomyces sp. S186 TaxID=3434395 RepID=UPI003F6668DC